MSITKLSVSRLKLFYQCKAKYNYNYNLKLPKKEFKHLIFGKCCHRILELYHLALIENPELQKHSVMKDAFQKSMEEYKDQIDQETRKEIYAISLSYLKNEQTQKTDIKVISCEKPFEVLVDGRVLLNGAIDKISIDSDGIYTIADYKSSKDTKYLVNDKFQLDTYAYVLLHYEKLENRDFKKVKAEYVMLKHNFEQVKFEIGINDIVKIPEKFLKCADDIAKETEFKPSPSNLCSFCDYIDVCPKAYKKKSSNWL